MLFNGMSSVRNEKFYFSYNVPYSGCGVLFISNGMVYAVESKDNCIYDIVTGQEIINAENLFYDTFDLVGCPVSEFDFKKVPFGIKDSNGLTIEDYLLWLNPTEAQITVVKKDWQASFWLSKIAYVNGKAEMIAVHNNHFQTSGDGWQTNSCSMVMEQGDYYDLVEQYQRNQNTRVGDESLLDGVPEEIKNQLYLFGGSVEWSESSDTYTWETTIDHVVLDHNGETIWSDQYNSQK